MNKLIEQLKVLMQKIVSLAKTRPVWFSLGVIAVAILTVFTLGNRNTLADYDVESVGRRDVVNLVDVTGKVNTPDKVDLCLERGGKIAKIEVSVGDEVNAGKTLVITNNSDLWAGLEEAQANLAVEKLNLEEIRETSVLDERSAFTDLVNTLQDAHTSVEDAIENKLSEIFRGSASSKQIGITSDFGTVISLGLSLDEKLDIRYKKTKVDKAIVAQGDLVNSITKDNILDTTDALEETLLDAQDLLDDVTDAFNDYHPNDLSYQEKVDAQRINLFSARNLVSDALIDLRSARQDYLGEVASLVSDSSSDYLRSALLQQERVNAAQARVNAALAEIGKSIVKAPFSGTVTKIDTEVGEIVSSNSPIVSMISYAEFEIEAYVAEADISRVTVGKTANVTLDAYGTNENFVAELVFVDPAETVIEGVSTYRALLHFKKQDEAKRSGMTANIEIVTGESKNVLAIPQRAVFDKDGKTLVRVFEDKKMVEKEVSTGLKGFDGYIEITGGLEEGEQVVVFSRD